MNLMSRFLGLVSAIFLIIMVLISQASAEDIVSCDPIDMEIVNTPVPPQRANSLRQYYKVKNSVDQKADVLVLGDSIMAGWPANNLSSVFKDRRIYNFGVSSDRVQNLIWRMKDTDLSSLQLKDVVLMIGVNSLADGISSCAIVSSIRSTIEIIRERWPNAHLTIFGILPHGKGYITREEDRLAINTAVKAMTEADKDAIYVNADKEISCGLQGVPGYLATNLPFWPFYIQCKNYLADNVHLTADGYAVLANELRKK